MPPPKFHLYKGRSEEEVSLLLDAAHEAMVQSFDVPKEHRYQVVSGYRHPFLQTLDTGLDILRTQKFVRGNSPSFRIAEKLGYRRRNGLQVLDGVAL